MKKIIAFLIAMVFSTQIYAALPNDVSEFAISAPLFKGNIEFGANLYYLRFSTPVLDYALMFPTVLLERGKFQRATPQFDFGYDVNLGFRFPCTSRDIKLIYRWYQENDKRFVATDDGVIIPLIFATTPRNARLSIANVRNRVKQHAFDIEFGQHLLVDTLATLRCSLGVRSAHIKNELDVVYFFDRRETRRDLQQAVDQKSNFMGFGPRFGMDGTFHLGSGIGLVGHLSTAFLAGHQKTKLLSTIQTSQPSPSSETFLERLPSEVHIVPNIDAKIGLNFSHQFCYCQIFTVELGYFVSHYFNVVSRVSGLNNRSGEFSIPGRKIDDASFNGPYIGVQVVL